MLNLSVIWTFALGSRRSAQFRGDIIDATNRDTFNNANVDPASWGIVVRDRQPRCQFCFGAVDERPCETAQIGGGVLTDSGSPAMRLRSSCCRAWICGIFAA
jgi:hypothetical protein